MPMQTRPLILLLLVLTLPGTDAAWSGAAQRPGFDLGEPASLEEIMNYGRSVYPDGAGLPPGRGGVRAGRALYSEHCLRCHGVEGRGGTADALAGATQKLSDAHPEKTIGTFWPSAVTLFDFIQRSKPMEQPGLLSNEEAYALTAYLLHLNGLLGEGKFLDAARLPRLRMPNRDGFLDSWEPPSGQPAATH